MILTCSSCTTRFLVDAAAIGAAGRHVRCARCQHSWFQEPAADLPHSVVPGLAEPPPPGQASESRAEAVAPVRRPAPLRRGANLPALPRKPNRMAELLAWGALALFVAGLSGGGYLFRDQIIHAWPQAAKLYAALGIESPASLLRLSDYAFSRGMQGAHAVLTVTGAISNDGKAEIAAPRVLVKLRNAAGRDIFTWTYQLPNKILAAGEKVKFETSLMDPPEEARNMEIILLPAY